MKLYRILVKTTNSVQPDRTFWNKEVKYCGYDREEALRIYHENTPGDFWYGFGNRARKTVAQGKEIS